jgi:hypothetical protein
MAQDVWGGLVQGMLAFARARANDLVATTFKDAGAFVGALADSPVGHGISRLQQLKTDVQNLTADGAATAAALKTQIDKAKNAAQAMGTALGASPPTPNSIAQAAASLGDVLAALDTARDIVAQKIGAPVTDQDQVRGIIEPLKKPFSNLAAGASQGFDALCHALLGIDHAGSALGDHLAWDRGAARITARLAQSGASQIGPLAFDGATVEAFVGYQNPVTLGVTVKANVKAGLRSGKLLEKIVPSGAPSAQADSVAVTLDTRNGLTFGDGPNKKLTLPVRFSFPGIELRELAIALPEGADAASGRLDLMFGVAGKLGDAIGIVTSGGGVSLAWKDGGGFDVITKPPDEGGLTIDAGIVKGGGYLRYKPATHEYGGVLDLRFTEIGVTAIGLITTDPLIGPITTDPFSFVVVMSVHFLPKIELSFGFTLNGVGGLLAIGRGLSTDELVKGLSEGAVSSLLFPDDPVMAAPGILTRLDKIFPKAPGGFVVGPIVELGWGSQAGFLKARVGVVLALPNPAIVILGAVQVGVPSADAPENLRIVDLRAELMAEITPDFFLVRVSLANSKIAGIVISGDLGVLIRWSGGGEFAFSAGGFFPKYHPPPELSDMRRLALELSPPVDFIKLRASAYFAITANTLQFGGAVALSADLGVVSGRASLSVDALFQWSPRFAFDFIIDASVEISAFGESVAGVSFHGELSGMKPWRLEGTASVHILFWTAHLDIPPIEWGDHDTTPLQTVSPVDIVHDALNADAAWTVQPPAGTEMIVRLVEDKTTPLLVHPLGALETKQLLVPLETTIDRVGSAAVDTRYVNLAAPKVGTQDAKVVVSHATDYFPPGHFINLTADEQVARPDFQEFPCGLRVAAPNGAAHGAATGVVYEWHTVFPHGGDFPVSKMKWNLAAFASVATRNSAVAAGLRQARNAYMPVRKSVDPGRAALNAAGLVTVLRRDDLTRPAGVPQVMNTADAARLIKTLPEGQDNKLQLVAVGFAA